METKTRNSSPSKPVKKRKDIELRWAKLRLHWSKKSVEAFLNFDREFNPEPTYTQVLVLEKLRRLVSEGKFKTKSVYVSPKYRNYVLNATSIIFVPMHVVVEKYIEVYRAEAREVNRERGFVDVYVKGVVKVPIPIFQQFLLMDFKSIVRAKIRGVAPSNVEYVETALNDIVESLRLDTYRKRIAATALASLASMHVVNALRRSGYFWYLRIGKYRTRFPTRIVVNGREYVFYVDMNLNLYVCKPCWRRGKSKPLIIGVGGVLYEMFRHSALRKVRDALNFENS